MKDLWEWQVKFSKLGMNELHAIKDIINEFQDTVFNFQEQVWKMNRACEEAINLEDKKMEAEIYAKKGKTEAIEEHHTGSY